MELTLQQRLGKGITSEHELDNEGEPVYAQTYLDFRYKDLLPDGSHFFAENGIETLPELELENIYHEFNAAIENGSRLKLAEFHNYLVLGAAYYALQSEKHPDDKEVDELKNLFQNAAIERLTKNVSSQVSLCERMSIANLKQAGLQENEESQRFSTRASHWSALKEQINRRFKS